jgi:hypothetical protein
VTDSRWDGSVDVCIGDKLNGFMAEETFAIVAGILPWPEEAFAHFRRTPPTLGRSATT